MNEIKEEGLGGRHELIFLSLSHRRILIELQRIKEPF